jgi:hypothetical protein
MKKPPLKALTAGLLAVLLVLSLAACGLNLNTGGKKTDDPDPADDNKGGGNDTPTIISTLAAVQNAFLKTGAALGEVCEGIEAGIAGAQPFSLKSKANALSFAPLAYGDGDDKAVPPIGDLEGYFLVSYINTHIDDNFAKADETKSAGEFAYYIDMLTALEAKFEETEETVLTADAVKYKKTESGYEIINPIYSTDEGHKDEITAYFKIVLTPTTGGVSMQNGMCDADGNAVAEHLPAEHSRQYAFRAADGKAAVDVITAGGEIDFRLEVVETTDGTYIQMYQTNLALFGAHMSWEMFEHWNAYLQSDVEENLHLPRSPFLRFKLSPDKQTGTMKVIRDVWTEFGTGLVLPESWLTVFDADTALTFGDLIVFGGPLSEETRRAICTYAYHAADFPEEA